MIVPHDRIVSLAQKRLRPVHVLIKNELSGLTSPFIHADAWHDRSVLIPSLDGLLQIRN